MWDIDGFLKLFKLMVNKGASDLHLRVPSPPVLRIDGALTMLEDLPAVTPPDLEILLENITTLDQRSTFRKELELDIAHSIPGLARFRVSALRQRGTISLAFRLVPIEVLSIDDLQLPPICKELILKLRGLILVTGPTGSGKSTTMAAMIDYLNENEARNVITIEDPIEYLHSNKRCLIAQRDLGDDTKSFADALVHALRHDPDVIVVGEMRDLDTITTAIRAAETGHLVLGTLHTIDAAQTVDRMIDIFPADQQSQIRFQLSQVMESVLSQTLLPRIDGGRTAAFEIMVATPAVRNLIREGKTSELPNVMRLSAKDGMNTLDQVLTDLVGRGVVSQEEVMMKASNPDQLKESLDFQHAGLRPAALVGEVEQVM
jgi:twitching motility protein PilT